MIFDYRLTDIVPQMSGATIECVFAAEGDALKMGSKLVDLSVDLTSAFAQECPPISYYRIVVRETAILRRIEARPGDFVGIDSLVALFSTEPDEPLDQPAARALRVTVAGIMHHDGMLTGAQS